jgi:Subtilase family
VLTLYHRYFDRLFTGGSGTSYAAPRVAFSAAQILTRFPQASANLVRALLVGSADIPEPSRDRLQLFGTEAIRNICGHGLVNLERAAFSDDARVTLYAEDELARDHFAVYRIPIPEAFQARNGERAIRVTLAFDPPIRHTRNDYAGLGMSFRLIRGCEPDLIFEHYRRREQAEGPLSGTCAEIQLSTRSETASAREGDHSIRNCHVQARCRGVWRELLSRRALRKRLGDTCGPAVICSHRRTFAQGRSAALRKSTTADSARGVAPVHKRNEGRPHSPIPTDSSQSRATRPTFCIARLAIIPAMDS